MENNSNFEGDRVDINDEIKNTITDEVNTPLNDEITTQPSTSKVEIESNVELESKVEMENNAEREINIDVEKEINVQNSITLENEDNSNVEIDVESNNDETNTQDNTDQTSTDEEDSNNDNQESEIKVIRGEEGTTIVYPPGTFEDKFVDGAMIYTTLDPIYEEILRVAEADENGEKIRKGLTPEEEQARNDRINKAKIMFEHGCTKLEELISQITNLNVVGVSSDLVKNPLFDEFIEQEFVGNDTEVTPVLSVNYNPNDSRGTRLFKLYVNNLITAALSRNATEMDSNRRSILGERRVRDIDIRMQEMQRKMELQQQLITTMLQQREYYNAMTSGSPSTSTSNPPVPRSNPSPNVSTSNVQKSVPTPVKTNAKKKIPKARARRMRAKAVSNKVKARLSN